MFLQQSSVEWCSSLWLDAIREIDPTFRRTVIVVSKFDNRLKVKSFFFFFLPFLEANLGLKEMNIIAIRCIALVILLIVV